MGDPKLFIYEDATGLKYPVPADKRTVFLERMKEKGIELRTVGAPGAPFSPPAPAASGGGTTTFPGADAPEPEAEMVDPDRPAGMGFIEADDQAASAAVSASAKSLSDTEHGVPGDRHGVASPDLTPDSAFGGLESFGRGYLDQAGFGHSDEAAGMGAMADEAVLQSGAYRLIDPVLRFFGTDIPMRNGPVAHTATRGFDAPVQGGLDTAADAYEDASADYLGNNKQAFEAHPGAYIAGGATAGVPQAVAMRGLGGAGRAAEAEAAAARSGWAARTMAGVKDTVSKGNLASAALSAHGHAEGDAWADRVESGTLGFAGEVAGGAMAAPFAEALLAPARALGRGTMGKLKDPMRNPRGAADVQAAINAGASAETFAKPKNFYGGGVTSEAGLRPGPAMEQDYASAASLGSAQPAEQLRKQASDRLAGALETERQTLGQQLRKERADYYATPEGSKPIDRGVIAMLPPEIQTRYDVKMKSFWTRDHKGEPVGVKGIDAEVLDEIIDDVDDLARNFSDNKQHDAVRRFARNAQELREIRKQVYPGGAWIAEQHHGLRNEFEAKTSALGIQGDPRLIRETPGSKHSQSIYNRLEQGPDPMLKQAVEGLEPHDPGAADLVRRSQGISAQQRLVSEAHSAPGAGLSMRGGRPVLVGPDLAPGLRVAGLENLGLNSQGALRGGMSGGAPVTPEEWQMLMRLLGKHPNEQEEQR